MNYLVLLRHGESQWNLENRFTGWTDSDLTPRGEQEAEEAGRRLLQRGMRFDKMFTSALTRAIRTGNLVLDAMGITDKILAEQDKALNERHYGDLQGLNKAEAEEKFCKDVVHQWRRGYATAPPNGESLRDTRMRVLPYFFREIFPQIQQGKNILVVAHGNSLRALCMRLDNLSEEEVVDLNIPTGVPLIYEYV